jgi:hypothetical protein
MGRVSSWFSQQARDAVGSSVAQALWVAVGGPLGTVSFKVGGVPLEKVELGHNVPINQQLTQWEMAERIGFVTRAIALVATLVEMELSP